MIKYEIEGGHLPVVICYPEPYQTLCTEKGAMSWMSPNMKMDTNTGGGIGKVFSRMFSGESIFMNEYTPEGGSGMIAFASSFPGSIIPYQVTDGNGIIVQKRGFLAMEKGLNLSIYFQKKLGRGFFGGYGTFLHIGRKELFGIKNCLFYRLCAHLYTLLRKVDKVIADVTRYIRRDK